MRKTLLALLLAGCTASVPQSAPDGWLRMHADSGNLFDVDVSRATRSGAVVRAPLRVTFAKAGAFDTTFAMMEFDCDASKSRTQDAKAFLNGTAVTIARTETTWEPMPSSSMLSLVSLRLCGMILREATH